MLHSQPPFQCVGQWEGWIDSKSGVRHLTIVYSGCLSSYKYDTEGIVAIHLLQGEEESCHRIPGYIKETRWTAIVLQLDELWEEGVAALKVLRVFGHYGFNELMFVFQKLCISKNRCGDAPPAQLASVPNSMTGTGSDPNAFPDV